jgi:hypothetical protein
MVKRNKHAFFAIAVVIVLVLISAGVMMSSSPTGQATQKAAGQQQLQNSPPPQYQSVDEIRLQECTSLANSHPAGERTAFVPQCMDYLYKFCFDNTQCGPYPCVEHKCQVS